MIVNDEDELYDAIESHVVKEYYCHPEYDSEPDLILEGVFLNDKPMLRFTWWLAMNLDYPIEITFK